MTTFDKLGLCPELLQSVARLGFTNPTEVQSEVIPVLLGDDRRDLVALAQTGTGKTAAFGLPILQQLSPGTRPPQALILCPTRELCMQIARDLKQLAHGMAAVRILPVYGGADIRTQIVALKRGVHITVATPGRMVDLMRRKVVDFSSIGRVVLDEADEMLSMGFEEDLQTILSAIPKTSQTLLFSATMPRKIHSITRGYMRNPLEITIGTRNSGAENVDHEYYMVHAADRYHVLKRIVDAVPGMYGIVFCRTRLETQQIADRLARDGVPAMALHGDLSQAQRDQVMKKFRDRHCPLLVATDVAARGLDVSKLTHIINFGLPDDLEVYTHRSGRTGRAGLSGVSIVLLNLREHAKLRRIEQKIGREFTARQVPTGRDICRNRIMECVESLRNLETESELLDELMPVLAEKMADLTPGELVRKLVFMELRGLLEFYRGKPDIVSAPHTPREKPLGKPSGKSGPSFGAASTAELVLSVGSVNGLTPKKLLRMVEAIEPGQGMAVGRVKIAAKQSYFEVPASSAAELLTRLNSEDIQFAGRRVRASVAEPRYRGTPGRVNRRYAGKGRARGR